MGDPLFESGALFYIVFCSFVLNLSSNEGCTQFLDSAKPYSASFLLSMGFIVGNRDTWEFSPPALML